jgi:hypothetical protein
MNDLPNAYGNEETPRPIFIFQENMPDMMKFALTQGR